MERGEEKPDGLRRFIGMRGTTALPYGWVSCPVFSGATLFGGFGSGLLLHIMLNGYLLPTPQSSIGHERTYRQKAWGEGRMAPGDLRASPCARQEHELLLVRVGQGNA